MTDQQATSSGDLSPTPAVGRAALTRELDDLEILPYTDPTAAAEPALAMGRRASEHGFEDLVQRARLVHADVIGRQGDVGGAGAIARQVLGWATAHEDQHLMARGERLLGSFYSRIGDMASALEHSVRSVELLGPAARPRLVADHLMALALAYARTSSFDAARDRFATVLRIADETSDHDLRIATLNNLAFTEYWAGDPLAAMRVAARMRAAAEHHDVPLDASCLDTVARAQIMMGEYAEAEKTLQPVLAPGGESLFAEADDVPEILLTVAECQRMLGAVDRAQASLDEAGRLCDERDLQDVRVRVLEEQAALYAAQGAFQQAYEQHREFHVAREQLYTAEREVRARSLATVYETEEAQRSSRRFREMSLRDPLTGLYNRRYVDDRLPGLLSLSRDEAASLAIAVADLDHFKRVNDEYSHETGDEVLRRIGPLLEAAAGPDGFAARLGGEEFLVVLPGLDHAQALERCELLRTTVRDHPWAALVGELPITVSIGVVQTFAGAQTTSELLAEADKRLYVAKRSGRDRVVGD